ncbi:flagellar biosynthesis anti-sigma factor FlgM [Pseudomonas cyclaminis]|uniref:flagellar biosynthesis anti-sigma factor FlgM n=1 Tax=Pseudomonas cyclaminis TaxID=2781239 RepID=UPI00382E8C2E
MVIDFSRLNNTPATSGTTRTTGTKESVEAKAPPLPAKAEQASQSGEPVHLSNEAQQLQKVTDSLRDQPVVNTPRVAQEKPPPPDGSYQVDSNRVASKLLNFEAER